MSDPLAAAAERLRAAGVENPRREARLLWDLANHEETGFARYVLRRGVREPFAYLSGHREFYGLDFAVGPGCLIPRPDTETLIETALRLRPDRSARLSIIDLGTGSGCLLVTLLSLYPNAHGVGIDVSPEALAWAARNLEAHKLADRASLIETGWPEESSPGFDLVISNPPYIPSADIAALEPEVRDFEPRGALDGGPDGLAVYRLLAPRVVRMLAPGGLALIEIGQGQGADTSSIFSEYGLRPLEINHDLAGVPRCLALAAAS
ncbi:MAG: peptide chain release factor N(5)-glutamine methyltransferase [Proteobacteria bacterium]|nr:peptide chain release factor N(5)-glutamine methyltransferase [Pseudomonadota bacterium]